MGKTQSKHYDLASSYWPKEGVASMQLLLSICELAEEKAAKLPRCTERLMDKTQELRDCVKQWQQQSQKDLERLQGGNQVLKVASALSLLHSKLMWCHERVRRVSKQPALLQTTQQRQCDKLLQILALAHEAQLNFSTAFQVAVQEGQRQHKEHRHSTHRAHRATSTAGQGAEQGSDAGTASARHMSGGGAKDAAPAASLLDNEQPSAAMEEQIGAYYPADEENGSSTARETGAASAGVSSSLPGSPDAASPVEATAEDGTASASAAAEWDGSELGFKQLMQQAWQGDPAAILAVAPLLRQGTAFGPPDCRTARQLLQLAAEAGVAQACLVLGHMAEAGEGLLVADHAEAASWYGRAAHLGSAEGAYCYGHALQHGIGVQQDELAAASWYSTAREAGHVGATNNLGCLLYQRSLSSHTTSTSRSTAAMGTVVSSFGSPGAAASDAAQLFYQAAQQGSVSALFNLGVCYAEGVAQCAGTSSRGDDPGAADLAAAADCFARAAAQAHTGAHVRLGQLHAAQGRLSAARSHFAAAAEAGDATALFELAKLAEKDAAALCRSCEDGTGTHAAVLLAQEAAQGLYLHAAEAGEAGAHMWVGNWLWDSGDAEGAAAMWAAAAEQGDASALLALGAVAAQGDECHGIHSSLATALACYKLAASLGCAEAAQAVEGLERGAAAALLEGSLTRLAAAFVSDSMAMAA